MNDSFSDSFSEDVPLGDFDEPAGLEALFEGGDDDFLQSFVAAFEGGGGDSNHSNPFDAFNMSMAKHLGENLQDFINDLKAGIKGETGLTASSFYTLLILYLSVIVFGVSGNSLVLIAVLGKPTMRTAHNYFVVALALSDLFLCLFSMPITLWELLFEQWPFGANTTWLCRCFASGKVLPLFMSSMAIVAVGWDRYRCIIQSERSPFTTRDAAIIVTVMVILSLAAVAPVFTIAKIDSLIDFQETSDMGDILVCRETWTPNIRLVYKLTTCTFQFVLPVVLVMYVNCSILLRLRSRPPSQHQNTNERRRRINNIIIAVTCVFFFSWLPLNVFQLMSEFGQSGFKFLGMTGNEEVVYGLLHLLGTANACFNPILYGYLNENFRNEYKSIYRRMPWYSHSFHRGVGLPDEFPHESDVNVVQLQRDQTNGDLVQSRQQLISQKDMTKESDASSNSNVTENRRNFEKVMQQSSKGTVLLVDNFALDVIGQSDSSRTFSSPEGVTPNYDDVTTLDSSSSYLLWRPSNGASIYKTRLFCDAMESDVDSNAISSCKFVHQAIGHIVTSLENCEERKATLWVTPKDHTAMETYV